MLAAFRIEGQVQARNVDLDGEASENDRVLLSVQEAAWRTGMSTSIIRRWIETGRLESFGLEGDRHVFVALGKSCNCAASTPRPLPRLATYM